MTEDPQYPRWTRRAHAAAASAAGALNSGPQLNYRGSRQLTRHDPLADKKLLAFPSANHTPHSNFDWKDAVPSLKGNYPVRREMPRSRSVCVNTAPHTQAHAAGEHPPPADQQPSLPPPAPRSCQRLFSNSVP